MTEDENGIVWVVRSDGSAPSKAGWRQRWRQFMPQFLSLSLMLALIAGVELESTFLKVGAVVLGLIFFVYMFVRSARIMGKATIRVTKLVTSIIRSQTPLENDSGQGRLTVVSEGQSPDGQVSLQDEDKQGQVALAKAQQKESQNQ